MCRHHNSIMIHKYTETKLHEFRKRIIYFFFFTYLYIYLSIYLFIYLRVVNLNTLSVTQVIQVCSRMSE
jgi:hypothetical protein